MKVEKFVIGMIQTNCYLVQNEESKECFLVDPAICPEELVSHIKSEGLELKAILLTHGHFDHIMGIDGFLKEFPVPVYAHEEEQGLLNDAVLNASAEYGPGYTFSGAEYLKDGQKLTAAGMEIEVLYTDAVTIFLRKVYCSAGIPCSGLPSAEGICPQEATASLCGPFRIS